MKHSPRPLVIIYSGEGSKANPEIVLKDEAALMLTFWDVHERKGKLTKRMQFIRDARNGEGKTNSTGNRC